MSTGQIPASRYGHALLLNGQCNPSVVLGGGFRYYASGTCECDQRITYSSGTAENARKGLERKHRAHLVTCPKQAELARDFPPVRQETRS